MVALVVKLLPAARLPLRDANRPDLCPHNCRQHRLLMLSLAPSIKSARVRLLPSPINNLRFAFAERT